MARIIYLNDVYQEVSLQMFHESEIQAALASQAQAIFTGYHYASFTILVETEDDSGKPDFVLVENGYRKWYVGEVEMLRHDLLGHVLRQVRIFNNAFYGESHASYIYRQHHGMDFERLRLLIESVRPTVLVVADKMDDSWRNILHIEGAKLGIFEAFRKENSADLIFRINGDVPEIPNEVLTVAEFDKSLPRILKLHTPSSIPVGSGDKIALEYNGILSEWIYMASDDKAWLNPVGYIDLPKHAKYLIKKLITGKFEMEMKGQ